MAVLACGDDPTAVVPDCGTPPGLVPGVPVTGELGPGSARRAGAFIDHYTVQLPGPDMIRLRMTSAAVDPFLFLFDDAGRILTQAFDRDPDAEPSVAELHYSARAGCYVVGATSWTAGATGGYVLLLTLP